MAEAGELMKPVRAEVGKLNAQYDKATAEEKVEIKKQIVKVLGSQSEADGEIKEMGERVQLYQEMGGLIGRIILAVLIIFGISRVLLLKLFQVPALLMIPLTYMVLVHQGGSAFLLAYGVCGLLTVAQFSYFGEYLPKVFPLHLRGTGGSFATNVGGRMVGTSMAVVTSNFIAPMLAGPEAKVVPPLVMAQAAGYVALSIAVIAFIVGFFLPEPKAEAAE